MTGPPSRKDDPITILQHFVLTPSLGVLTADNKILQLKQYDAN